jgi:hypothetical protein
MIRVLPCLFALAALACSSSPTASDDVPLDREFTLKPGESATVEGTGLRVAFRNVPEDSRCPVDVTCIHAGDAVIALTVASAAEMRHLELRSNTKRDEPVGAYRLQLEGVEPAARSTNPIPPGDYRASLRMVRP